MLPEEKRRVGLRRIDRVEETYAPPQNWNSWLNQKGRRRNPLRLSISVDSIQCTDNDFLSSSVGSLTNPADLEEDDDRSVNNILDAVVGGGSGSGPGSGSGSGTGGSGVSGGSIPGIVGGMSEGISWLMLDMSSTSPPSSSSMKKKYIRPPIRHNQNSSFINNSEGGDSHMSWSRSVGGSSVSPSPAAVPRSSIPIPNANIITLGNVNSNSNGGTGKAGVQLINNNMIMNMNKNENENMVEEYEHVYCQLDPYFTPPIGNLAKSQPITSLISSPRLSTRSSLRSWGRFAAGTMDKELTVIPMLQQALVVRYREMLDLHLEAPQWYRQHMGTTDLDEIIPVVYQLIPSDNATSTGVYGTNTKRQPCLEQFRPILPHQIFTKTNAEDLTRAFWLEGEAGSGKTILCLKLIQEWTSYHSYGETNSPLNSRLAEFQIVLYIPLREVRKSLTRFIIRELIPKHSNLTRIKPANILKFLTLLGSSMLILLDGLDDVTDEGLLKEVQDLLNGLLFPQALVLMTSRGKVNGFDRHYQNLRGPGLRKYTVTGMDWTQIQCSIRRYFTGRKFGNESRLAEILSDRPDLCTLASNPFMCLLLCSVFEEVGDVPCSTAEFYSALIRSLIFQNGLTDKPNSTIPPKYQKILEEFGKLTLKTIGETRVYYTESEIELACGNLDIIKMGLLSKPRPFLRKIFPKKSSAATYALTILHPALNTFASAYYLVTKVHSPNNLRRELEMLPGVEDLLDNQVQNSNVAFVVTSLVMELLQQKSAGLLLTLSLLDISINYLLALLRSAGFYETNLNAVCTVLSSIKHVTISVASEWVSEWKQVLSSLYCPFESVELVIKPGYPLSRLTEGLCLNESVNSVKFSSVPGQDWNGVEVNLVCSQLLRLLSEKTLRCLEISITCLEDKEHSRFQPFVDVFSFVLSRRVPLKKLVLDMDLTSSQLVQLVAYIRTHEMLEVLHVPHLGCGPEGFRAISDLLLEKPLLSLSVAGSWRSNSPDVEEDVVVFDPFPYSLSPLPTPVHTKIQTSGISLFSSLPRGPLLRGIGVNGSIKSPSIRRKRNAHLTESDKRNSDSVLFQRNFLPLPICDRENHEVDGFHAIFSVLRLRECRLKALNLSKCVMNWEDVICLGETIRKTQCLDSLRMEGMKLCDVLPVLLALQENTSLKMLDLSSPHVVIADEALQLVSNSLTRNSTLRLLSIQGWNVYIEEEQTLESLEILLRSSNLQDLDLSNIRIQVNSTSKKLQGDVSAKSQQSSPTTTSSPIPASTANSIGSPSNSNSSNNGKKDSISSVMSLISNNTTTPPPLICRSLSFLRLRGSQVEISKSQTWRSMDIMYHLTSRLDKDRLTFLDISLDSKDTNPPANEKSLIRTLKLISQSFPKLQTLIMAHWKLRVANDRTCKELIKWLSSGFQSLSTLNFDHSIVLTADTGNTKRLDHVIAALFLSHLKTLTEFSWTGFSLDLSTNQALAHLSKSLLVNSVSQGKLILKLEAVPLTDIKKLIAVVRSLPSKNGMVAEYINGNSICITKIGHKSEHLIFKLKRFL